MAQGESVWIKTWRAGMMAGVGVLMWLSTNFVSKESFKSYIESHRELNSAVIQRIDGSMADLKESTRRIEIKVDTILRDNKQASVYKQMLEEIYE